MLAISQVAAELFVLRGSGWTKQNYPKNNPFKYSNIGVGKANPLTPSFYSEVLECRHNNNNSNNETTIE